ncbi:hypothetical protein FALBO_15427 [Fusarium albosuccineum]|uniref:Zn(2)-C6 fungal-type domain-containing protein n=1 Tax=Fusarium albosuccineum TaxID=1237068 RepID=A0A8H4NYX5_9HYPO|nr:hypothetical protein FALBO_15427 [Fusarium albosuccineum]
MSNSGPSPAPQDSPPARKRQRTESSYPRRRSVTACTVCRGRKSKCDNKRPSCSFCLSIGATCVYEELRSDYSNYDSASLHIINRLDHLEKQMEERFDKLVGQKYTPPADSFEKPSVFPTSHYPIAEGILEWPVFEGLELQLHGRSLALVHQDPPNLTNPSIGPGTQDKQPHSGIVEALRDPFLDFNAI